MLGAAFWPPLSLGSAFLAGCVPVPPWGALGAITPCQSSDYPPSTVQPAFHFLSGCVSQPPLVCVSAVAVDTAAPFLFVSSSYGLTDVKPEQTHEVRGSRGSCGLRHAKQWQRYRVTLVVSNCLFVLLSRSRCYQRSGASRRVLLLTWVGVGTLLTSVNHLGLNTRSRMQWGEREGFCFSLSM